MNGNLGAPELLLILVVVLIPVVFIVAIVVIVTMVVRRKSAERDIVEQKKLELMNSLVQKFENSKDLVEFLKTEEGKRLSEGIGTPPQKTSTRTVLLLVLAGICLFYGLRILAGFAIASSMVGFGNETSRAFVGLSVAGIVLITAAAFFFWLSNFWKK
jgi:hypothetical protein